MKKQWLLLALGLVLLLLLAACGGDEAAVDDEATEEPEVVDETEEGEEPEAPVLGENESDADTPVEEADGGTDADTEGPTDSGVDELNNVEVDSETGEVESVRVDLVNTQADLVGYADLIQEETGIVVQLDIADLEPGVHAVHFHIGSSCTPPDDEGEGEPMLTPGSLPDITVEEDRTVQTEFAVEDATLQPDDANSLLAEEGTSLVIHDPAVEEIEYPEAGEAPILACGTITP
ncbi:superoxide dismutase family protein [Indiicoccus explosivorum]|uniref:superoxide dismutase family protein n=1 Tax=Indiicoccus explosivorum TaxID=1917864 RepID=UPI000B450CE6|nr:superoxide dismutase family protein [Indiicoccus explosivorum]